MQFNSHRELVMNTKEKKFDKPENVYRDMMTL